MKFERFGKMNEIVFEKKKRNASVTEAFGPAIIHLVERASKEANGIERTTNGSEQ